jgi:hypothetical protein
MAKKKPSNYRRPQPMAIIEAWATLGVAIDVAEICSETIDMKIAKKAYLILDKAVCRMKNKQ